MARGQRILVMCCKRGDNNQAAKDVESNDLDQRVHPSYPFMAKILVGSNEFS